MTSDKTPKSDRDICKELAATTGLAVVKVKELLDAQAQIAKREIKDTGIFVLHKVGKLKSRETAARTGRNPKTGASVPIKARRRVSLSLNKAFKEGVQ